MIRQIIYRIVARWVEGDEKTLKELREELLEVNGLLKKEHERDRSRRRVGSL